MNKSHRVDQCSLVDAFNQLIDDSKKWDCDLILDIAKLQHPHQNTSDGTKTADATQNVEHINTAVQQFLPIR